MFKGKAAFVTGGGGGIGLAIACALARHGAKVAIADIDEALLDTALRENPELGLVALPCDVADPQAVKMAVDSFAADEDGLDILVNNAVYLHHEALEDIDAGLASRMIDIGLKGCLWASQAAIPHLRRSPGGVVLYLSSITVMSAFENTGVYTSIKGAMDALTRQQAAELGHHGIRVNAVAPGSVATPGTARVVDADGWRAREAKTLIGRLPTADDIARAAVFLCSDDARCVTGVTLKVDSGMTLKGP